VKWEGKWGERVDGNLGREKLFIFIRNLKNGCLAKVLGGLARRKTITTPSQGSGNEHF
jgi:hypothetical protein